MNQPHDDEAVPPSLGAVAADLIELVAATGEGPKPWLDGVLLRAALRPPPLESVLRIGV